MPTYRKIKPASINTPYEADYEYLLMWLASNGGVRQFYFSSTEGSKDESFKNSVIDTSSDFRGVPNALATDIEIFTKSLNREEFDYASDVLKSNRILLVGKDSTTTPIAIRSAKKRTTRIVKDFELSFKIALQEPELLNV